MMVVYDPSRVFVGISGKFGLEEHGKTLPEIYDSYDNIVGAINGGGFDDRPGHMTGGEPWGIVMSQGEVLWGTPMYYTWDTIGITCDNKLVVGRMTVQEAVDMTYAAFDYAQRDRNPVLILTDGVMGTIMEPVVLPEMRPEEEVRALKEALRATSAVGHDSTKEPRGVVAAGRWSTKDQEQSCRDAEELYKSWKKDVQVETLWLDDAELILTGYGICGRIAKSSVSRLRGEGYKVGFVRPKTLNPFPYDTYDVLDYGRVRAILDVEMSIPAQMVRDVELAVSRRCPIETCLHAGGEIMGREEVIRAAKALLDR